jgi:hypothetical protein
MALSVALVAEKVRSVRFSTCVNESILCVSEVSKYDVRYNEP